MEVHDISFFRKLWEQSVKNLENLCEEWEKPVSDATSVPEDVNGEIRTAIGLAKLLISQKLKQFKGLIDDSEFHTGEKEITCTDLQGFWDMVCFEVEKIQNIFVRLDECRNNEWKFVEKNSSEPLKKKAPMKKVTSTGNIQKEKSKAHVLAAKQRIAEVKKRMAAERKNANNLDNFEIQMHDKDSESLNSINSEVNTAGPDKKMTMVIIEDKKSAGSKKKNTPSKTGVYVEDGSAKLSSSQKKKHSAMDKENTSLDCDSYHTPPKQAKKKSGAEDPNFVKLQCVTRSAAKRALLLKQNV